MVKPVGGRGKKAPYQTIQMRVPAPIKPDVENLIQRYRDEVLDKTEASTDAEQKPVDRFTELKAMIQEVLADPAVTRNGKDRGAVKRGLEALARKIFNNSDPGQGSSFPRD